MELRDEIDIIIRDGIRRGQNEKEIVDRIMAAGTQARKSDHIPIREYEELIREGKRKIQEARKILLRSIMGDK